MKKDKLGQPIEVDDVLIKPSSPGATEIVRVIKITPKALRVARKYYSGKWATGLTTVVNYKECVVINDIYNKRRDT